jgi:hypothetical protein
MSLVKRKMGVSRIEDIARHCELFFGEAISGFSHKIAYHFMAHVVGKNILLAMRNDGNLLS